MRVLIADDDDYQVRCALRLLIEQQFETAAIDEISSFGQLIEKSVTAMPDILLLDCELPGGDQVTFMGEIGSRYPSVSVVALSALPESRKEALDCGASAFISNNDPLEIFISIITRLSDFLHRRGLIKTSS